MPNCLQIRMLQSLLIITLMMLLALGVPWKARVANVPPKFLKASAKSNFHNYSLILNSPAFCGSKKDEVFLLILVRSIAQNTLRRQTIRRTWGSANKVHQKRLKVAFLFGKNEPVFNKHLKEEQTKYHDIFQESFQESYANLHVKTVMAWKWAVTFCSKSMFVIVCNDEIFVDVFKTVSYLKELVANKRHKTYYGCWMEKEGLKPNRNLKHKHGVSLKDYPGKHYPAFCNGNGYMASMQIIRKLYEMSLKTPPFMPDDAWCGVLAAKLALEISNIHDEIPISTRYKIIEHYLSLDKYVKAKMCFFPLDRKFSSCEVCVVHYLWQQITLYNKYTQPTLKKVSISQKKDRKIFPSFPTIFYVISILNCGIFISLYFSRNKKLPMYLSIFSILILIISIQIFTE